MANSTHARFWQASGGGSCSRGLSESLIVAAADAAAELIVQRGHHAARKRGGTRALRRPCSRCIAAD